MSQPDLSRPFRQITAIAIALGVTFWFVSLWVLFTRPNAISIWVLYGGLTIVISGFALLLAQPRWPPFVTGHANWSDHFAETSGGEYCIACKMPRLDHEHVWNGCVCRTCPQIRDEGHVWVGCYCEKCQSTRAVGHVPASCGVCNVCHNPIVSLRLVRHDYEHFADVPDRVGPHLTGTAKADWVAHFATGFVEMKCKHCDQVVVWSRPQQEAYSIENGESIKSRDTGP